MSGAPLNLVNSFDCPAAPICKMVGNMRESCVTGGSLMGAGNTQKCMAGLILLVARGQGLYTENMEQDLQQRRKMGFVLPPEADQ